MILSQRFIEYYTIRTPREFCEIPTIVSVHDVPITIINNIYIIFSIISVNILYENDDRFVMY